MEVENAAVSREGAAWIEECPCVVCMRTAAPAQHTVNVSAAIKAHSELAPSPPSPWTLPRPQLLLTSEDAQQWRRGDGSASPSNDWTAVSWPDPPSPFLLLQSVTLLGVAGVLCVMRLLLLLSVVLGCVLLQRLFLLRVLHLRLLPPPVRIRVSGSPSSGRTIAMPSIATLNLPLILHLSVLCLCLRGWCEWLWLWQLWCLRLQCEELCGLFDVCHAAPRVACRAEDGGAMERSMRVWAAAAVAASAVAVVERHWAFLLPHRGIRCCVVAVRLSAHPATQRSQLQPHPPLEHSARTRSSHTQRHRDTNSQQHSTAAERGAPQR